MAGAEIFVGDALYIELMVHSAGPSVYQRMLNPLRIQVSFQLFSINAKSPAYSFGPNVRKSSEAHHE